MRCSISNWQSPTPLLVVVHPHHTNKHQIISWITSKPPPCTRLLQLNRTSCLPPAALPLSSILVATTTSPPNPHFSVLLQTSGVCLIAFWIANFVVPDIILKDMLSNKTDEDAKTPTDDNEL